MAAIDGTENAKHQSDVQGWVGKTLDFLSGINVCLVPNIMLNLTQVLTFESRGKGVD